MNNWKKFYILIKNEFVGFFKAGFFGFFFYIWSKVTNFACSRNKITPKKFSGDVTNSYAAINLKIFENENIKNILRKL